MIMAMLTKGRIMKVRPVKRTALAIYTHMQMKPAHLHSQQTEAHNRYEVKWNWTHRRNGTHQDFF